jgi:hypothetical protein
MKTYSIDRTVIAAIEARARRERAQAVYRLLIAPVVSFVKDTLHAARPHRPLAG